MTIYIFAKSAHRAKDIALEARLPPDDYKWINVDSPGEELSGIECGRHVLWLDAGWSRGRWAERVLDIATNRVMQIKELPPQ